MTDQPTGRALAEAAAMAMGWREGANCWLDGWTQRDLEKSPPTERELLAWLHERGGVEILTRKGYAAASQIDTDYHEGTDMREALMRLVVAVAEREATNG